MKTLTALIQQKEKIDTHISTISTSPNTEKLSTLEHLISRFFLTLEEAYDSINQDDDKSSNEQAKVVHELIEYETDAA